MLSRSTRIRQRLVAAVAVAGMLAASGASAGTAVSKLDSSPQRGEAGRGVAAPAEYTAQVAPSDTTTITIETYGSNLAFEPESFSAKAGTTVRVRYINEGTLPHNFVIAQTDDDVDALAAASYQATESGYIPLELEDKMIAHTALASPGQTVEVTFTAPPPGEYTFICLVPGHSNMMLGTFTSLE